MVRNTLRKQRKLVIWFINVICLSPTSCYYTSCPNKWVAFNGNCYLFGHGDVMTFNDAKRYCQLNGGDLVHIENAVENNFLAETVQAFKQSNFWIGLTDEEHEGVWLWTDTDTPVVFNDWGPKEPNNLHNEDCACFVQWENYKWNDESCQDKFEPLCKIRKAVAELVG